MTLEPQGILPVSLPWNTCAVRLAAEHRHGPVGTGDLQLCLLPEPPSRQVNAAGFFQEWQCSKPFSSDTTSKWGTMLLPVHLWLAKRLILAAQQLFSDWQPRGSGGARQRKCQPRADTSLQAAFKTTFNTRKLKLCAQGDLLQHLLHGPKAENKHIYLLSKLWYNKFKDHHAAINISSKL